MMKTADLRAHGVGLEDRELLAWGGDLGDLFGAISQEASSQGEKGAKHAHLTGLPDCLFAARIRKRATCVTEWCDGRLSRRRCPFRWQVCLIIKVLTPRPQEYCQVSRADDSITVEVKGAFIRRIGTYAPAAEKEP